MTIELHWVWFYVLHLTPSVVVLAFGVHLYREMRPRILWQKKSKATRW